MKVELTFQAIIRRNVKFNRCTLAPHVVHAMQAEKARRNALSLYRARQTDTGKEVHFKGCQFKPGA